MIFRGFVIGFLTPTELGARGGLGGGSASRVGRKYRHSEIFEVVQVRETLQEKRTSFLTVHEDREILFDLFIRVGKRSSRGKPHPEYNTSCASTFFQTDEIWPSSPALLVRVTWLFPP